MEKRIDINHRKPLYYEEKYTDFIKVNKNVKNAMHRKPLKIENEYHGQMRLDERIPTNPRTFQEDASSLRYLRKTDQKEEQQEVECYSLGTYRTTHSHIELDERNPMNPESTLSDQNSPLQSRKTSSTKIQKFSTNSPLPNIHRTNLYQIQNDQHNATRVRQHNLEAPRPRYSQNRFQSRCSTFKNKNTSNLQTEQSNKQSNSGGRARDNSFNPGNDFATYMEYVYESSDEDSTKSDSDDTDDDLEVSVTLGFLLQQIVTERMGEWNQYSKAVYDWIGTQIYEYDIGQDLLENPARLEEFADMRISQVDIKFEEEDTGTFLIIDEKARKKKSPQTIKKPAAESAAVQWIYDPLAEIRKKILSHLQIMIKEIPQDFKTIEGFYALHERVEKDYTLESLDWVPTEIERLFQKLKQERPCSRKSNSVNLDESFTDFDETTSQVVEEDDRNSLEVTPIQKTYPLRSYRTKEVQNQTLTKEKSDIDQYCTVFDAIKKEDIAHDEENLLEVTPMKNMDSSWSNSKNEFQYLHCSSDQGIQNFKENRLEVVSSSSDEYWLNGFKIENGTEIQEKDKEKELSDPEHPSIQHKELDNWNLEIDAQLQDVYSSLSYTEDYFLDDIIQLYFTDNDEYNTNFDLVKRRDVEIVKTNPQEVIAMQYLQYSSSYDQMKVSAESARKINENKEDFYRTINQHKQHLKENLQKVTRLKSSNWWWSYDQRKKYKKLENGGIKEKPPDLQFSKAKEYDIDKRSSRGVV